MTNTTKGFWRHLGSRVTLLKHECRYGEYRRHPVEIYSVALGVSLTGCSSAEPASV